MSKPEAIQLQAWQSAFGTTQLSHAVAKMESLQRDLEAARLERDRFKEALKSTSLWFAELNRRGERGPSMDVTEVRRTIHEALYPKQTPQAGKDAGEALADAGGTDYMDTGQRPINPIPYDSGIDD